MNNTTILESETEKRTDVLHVAAGNILWRHHRPVLCLYCLSNTFAECPMHCTLLVVGRCLCPVQSMVVRG